MPPKPNKQQEPISHKQQLTTIAFLRIWQIIGDSKRGIEPILPIGRTTFLNGVKSGIFPQPVKLGVRTVAWKSGEIMAMVESIGAKA
jgi:predicted DNA-binding transcriptional regulator AlpA